MNSPLNLYLPHKIVLWYYDTEIKINADNITIKKQSTPIKLKNKIHNYQTILWRKNNLWIHL